MASKIVDYVSIVNSEEYQQRLFEMANSIKISLKLHQMRQQYKADLIVNYLLFLRKCLNH